MLVHLSEAPKPLISPRGDRITQLVSTLDPLQLNYSWRSSNRVCWRPFGSSLWTTYIPSESCATCSLGGIPVVQPVLLAKTCHNLLLVSYQVLPLILLSRASQTKHRQLKLSSISNIIRFLHSVAAILKAYLSEIYCQNLISAVSYFPAANPAGASSPVISSDSSSKRSALNLSKQIKRAFLNWVIW